LLTNLKIILFILYLFEYQVFSKYIDGCTWFIFFYRKWYSFLQCIGKKWCKQKSNTNHESPESPRKRKPSAWGSKLESESGVVLWFSSRLPCTRKCSINQREKGRVSPLRANQNQTSCDAVLEKCMTTNSTDKWPHTRPTSARSPSHIDLYPHYQYPIPLRPQSLRVSLQQHSIFLYVPWCTCSGGWIQWPRQ